MISSTIQNKPLVETKKGDLRHFYEVGSSWLLSLAKARVTREILMPDANIYYVEMVCVSSGHGNTAFEDVSKILIE